MKGGMKMGEGVKVEGGEMSKVKEIIKDDDDNSGERSEEVACFHSSPK